MTTNSQTQPYIIFACQDLKICSWLLGFGCITDPDQSKFIQPSPSLITYDHSQLDHSQFLIKLHSLYSKYGKRKLIFFTVRCALRLGIECCHCYGIITGFKVYWMWSATKLYLHGNVNRHTPEKRGEESSGSLHPLKPAAIMAAMNKAEKTWFKTALLFCISTIFTGVSLKS